MVVARYVFDTCAILETWRRNFPRDVAPGLWDRIEKFIDDGVIIAPEEVYEELATKDDEVLDWARHRKEQMFVSIDDEQIGVVREIVNGYPNLLKTGRNRADPFVVALAEARRLVVVTEEAPDGNPRRPKVPYVCAHRDVPCTDVVGLMRTEGWSLR